jgi:glycosyltransferase involved in cell wall biosynthesis
MKNKSDRPIKLLLVTHYYPNHRGGVEIVAGKLVDYLLKIGSIDIIWLASNVDAPPTDQPGLWCMPMPANNWIEKKLQIPYPLWTIPALYRLWKLVKDTDIIHIHDYLYFSNLTAFLFAKIQKKRLIITQHIGFIPYNNPLFRWLLSFLNATLGCWILRHADQTIFISDVVQKYFSEKTRFRQPALLIPNGVETSIFFPTDEGDRLNHRQQLNLPLEQPIFLFVGRFVEKKGLLILQELTQQFPDVYWLFAGWGSLDPSSWQLPNVRVFHHLQSSQLTPIYQLADILVLPSKGEGFPLVVQEAMACGTPVMVGTETAQACLAAESLIFSETVESDDVVQCWSVRIREILQDHAKLTQLRTTVAAFAQQYWNWQQTADRYYEIIRHYSLL